MAGNDLLVQALMGNQVQQDPALGAVLPRLQMAQAMMQQGMDGSPATKWQGIGRLAQALAGNYIQYKGLDDVQNIVKQRNDDTAAQMQYMRGSGDVPSSTVPPLTQAPPPASSGSFAGQLGGAEGGKNPAVVNPAGFSGQYQFGAARLADPSVGVYQPAPGEDLKANQWKGTFNVPGFPDVKTHADFLANPAAQKAAFDLHLADIDKNIAGLPGAVGQDPNGLRAVAHLGGVDGMKRFVSSGGLYDPADSNGTRLSDYYKRFSGAGTGPGVAARTGGVDVAGPSGAVPTVTPSGGLPPPTPRVGPAPMPPNVVTPAAPTDPNAAPPPLTGPHTYSRQEALDMMQRSINVMSNPHNQYNPALLKGAQGQLDFAKTLLGLDTYTVGPNGVQTNRNSGKQESAATPALNYQQTSPGIYTSPGAKPEFAPTPRTYTDAHGNVGAVMPGGGSLPLAPNPSGITGSSDMANAARTLAELGPKIANGTATPQEESNYNVAHQLFQQVKPVTLSPGQQASPVGSPLPVGMPPPVVHGSAPSVVPPSGPAPAVQPGMPSPAAAPPVAPPQSTSADNPLIPSARVKIWQDMAAKDAETVQKDQEKAAAGVPTFGTTATIRAMLPTVATGQGADAKLLVSQWGSALGIPPEKMQGIVGTNPVMGELLQKKLFELSTGAVRGMGAREPGSVISMFQRNYPNMSSRDMTIDAMTRLLDMDQIRNQDYAAGKQQFHNESINGIDQTKGYRGLAGFDSQFDKTNGPRVYAAAALAAGKLPYSTWSKGLSPEDQTQALKMAAQAWPDAGAFGPGPGGKEVWHTMGGR